MANGEPVDRNRLWQILFGVGVVALIVLVAFLLLRNDDDDGDSAATTTSEASTTTTEATTTTTGSGVITDEEAASVVWPDPFGDVRYAEATDAVAGYAEDFVGFDAPVYGEPTSRGDDTEEVEVRAVDEGAVTTVVVSRMSDDNWYVLGSTTPNIELDEPVAESAIDDPLQLSGRADAFEGTVQVAVYERGDTEPLGEGFVTGSSGELGPFSGEVSWDNPGGGWGVVLLYTVSMEDGAVWEATSIPVGFIGGD